MESALKNIRIVLVKTTHPGNIGATARAMKTMGLSELFLVDTCWHLSQEAIARATSAFDILQRAQVVANLSDAIKPCHMILGTSSRERNLPWPIATPEEIVPEFCAKAKATPVAIIFGRERDGLSNIELQQCSHHITIPTSKDFKSLNLAQAVQILAYECRKNLLKTGCDNSKQRQVASSEKLEGVIEHLQVLMDEVGFLRARNSKLLLQRIRRIILRADLDDKEINIIRGLFTTIERKINTLKD